MLSNPWWAINDGQDTLRRSLGVVRMLAFDFQNRLNSELPETMTNVPQHKQVQLAAANVLYLLLRSFRLGAKRLKAHDCCRRVSDGLGASRKQHLLVVAG